MKNESEFTKFFTKEFNIRGGLSLVLAGGNMMQQSGLPDRILSHLRTGVFFAEMKWNNNTPSVQQKLMLHNICSRGGIAFWVRGNSAVETVEFYMVKPDRSASELICMCTIDRLKTPGIIDTLVVICRQIATSYNHSRP